VDEAMQGLFAARVLVQRRHRPTLYTPPAANTLADRPGVTVKGSERVQPVPELLQPSLGRAHPSLILIVEDGIDRARFDVIIANVLHPRPPSQLLRRYRLATRFGIAHHQNQSGTAGGVAAVGIGLQLAPHRQRVRMAAATPVQRTQEIPGIVSTIAVRSGLDDGGEDLRTNLIVVALQRPIGVEAELLAPRQVVVARLDDRLERRRV